MKNCAIEFEEAHTCQHYPKPRLNSFIGMAIYCYGVAGSVCLMHTRLLHGSAPKLSAKPRTLFICEYTAEDAYALQTNHIPSAYMYECSWRKDESRALQRV